MPGKTIGNVMPFGYAGNPSRMSDCVIAPYAFPVASATNNTKIQFGAPVVFDATLGGVRAIKSGDTAAAVIGIAVRHIGQPHEDNENGWYYVPGDTVDVMLRGSIMVELENTTSVAARGAVYVDPTTGKYYGATGSGYITLANAKFATGKADANKIAEITLVERVI